MVSFTCPVGRRKPQPATYRCDAEPSWSGRSIASLDELPGLLATS